MANRTVVREDDPLPQDKLKTSKISSARDKVEDIKMKSSSPQNSDSNSNCKDCKKTHLPDPTRQQEQAKIIKDSLKFENNMYTAEYPYNELLSQLSTNEIACMRMMRNLEPKLKK